MTAKEAIDILWQYDVNFEPRPAEEVMHAIDMAINALTKEAWKEEHPVSPLLQKLATNLQPSKQDDLINRQAAIKIASGFCHPANIAKELAKLPSAQPDISAYSDKLWKRAYERGKAEAQDEIVRCKDCKYYQTRQKSGFLPQCCWFDVLTKPNDFCSNGRKENR